MNSDLTYTIKIKDNQIMFMLESGTVFKTYEIELLNGDPVIPLSCLLFLETLKEQDFKLIEIEYPEDKNLT